MSNIGEIPALNGSANSAADPKRRITASEIKKGCPTILLNLGKRVVAHLEKAQKYEEKADQHYTTASQYLAQAKAICNEGGFDAFWDKFCPSLGRSRAYELLAIAAGNKTIADVRAATRERVARHRANRESVTVTDKPGANHKSGADVDKTGTANEQAVATTGGTGTDAEASAEERRAYYAAGDAERDGDGSEQVRSHQASALSSPSPASVSTVPPSSLPSASAAPSASTARSRRLREDRDGRAGKTTFADIVSAWANAPATEQTRAIEAIGLDALLAAIPPSWIPLIEKRFQPATVPVAPAPPAAELEIPEYLRRSKVEVAAP